MPNKRPPLANGETYHIVIRAIEGLKLFRDKQDYFRIIHDLFEFNDKKRVSSKFRVNQYLAKKGQLTRSYRVNEEKRDVLVEILAFCLMPNHVHLLVRQIQDHGISEFMRKVGIGYACYYNQKYKRIGHVFQGRYRMVHIKDDKQLITVFIYIHTNPTAIIFPKWKEKGIGNLNKAIRFLESYRWSSYPDYLGNKNFPSVTFREFLIQTMGGVKECRRFINDWLAFKKELADSDTVAIE